MQTNSKKCQKGPCICAHLQSRRALMAQHQKQNWAVSPIKLNWESRIDMLTRSSGILTTVSQNKKELPNSWTTCLKQTQLTFRRRSYCESTRNWKKRNISCTRRNSFWILHTHASWHWSCRYNDKPGTEDSESLYSQGNIASRFRESTNSHILQNKRMLKTLWTTDRFRYHTYCARFSFLLSKPGWQRK